MDIASPLRSLLSPTAAGCVHVLAAADAADGLFGREVARRVGASSAAVARSALLGLVGIGLVARETSRRVVLYRLNREHLLWPAVEAALVAREVFVSRIVEFVATSSTPEAAVLLYGSVARGEATATSDVDLLVVFPDGIDLAVRDEFSAGLSSAVTGWTGNRVEIYDVTEADLGEHVAAGEAIVASWQADAHLLAGRRPSALTRLAA